MKRLSSFKHLSLNHFFFWISGLLLGLQCVTARPIPGNQSTAWTLVWHDEFNKNGAPDPANWRYEHGFVRNHELQWYQPDNAICTNGRLVIEARRESRPNPRYELESENWRNTRPQIEVTSASLSTHGLHEFTYGKFEMRARIDIRSGSWPAFWILGDRRGIGWPACGEVDIMEFYQSNVLANFGWQQDGQVAWRSIRKPVAEFGDPDWSTKFHTWTMEWDPTNMTLSLDGRTMNQLALADVDQAGQGNPFHSPVYIIINQAIGGDNGGDPSQTKFPIRMEVDWVRVYQRSSPSTH